MSETPGIKLTDYQHAVIQGGCGGIGYAVVEWLLHHTEARISVTCRHGPPCPRLVALTANHSRLHSYTLDLMAPDTIDGAWHAISEANVEVDLLVNASGLLHGPDLNPEKRLEDLSASALSSLFAVNATGPALVIARAINSLSRTRRVVIANVSARVGSIGDNRLGGWYGYRASKSALNMLTRTAAVELKRRLPEAICVAVHPGTVATALSAPFSRRVDSDALFTAERAASHLMNNLNALEPTDSGRFIAWDGQEIAW